MSESEKELNDLILKCGRENLRMSGCHISVPAMSGFVDKDNERVKFCIACNDKMPCNCIWEAVRTLQSDVKEHWNLNYQSDENISKRIIKLDSSVASLHSFELSVCKEPHPRILKERIEKLEKSDHDERISDLEKIDGEVRLINLEKAIDRIAEVVKRIHEDDMKSGKKPHKCPVCEGQGGTFCSGTMDESCYPCDGNGIVWG